MVVTEPLVPVAAENSKGSTATAFRALGSHDAVLGPAAYDLASLLQDARIDVPEFLELALLPRYVKARLASDHSFDPAGFAEIGDSQN